MIESMGGDILISCLEVLTFDEVASSNIESGFTECVAVDIFGFDGGDVAGVSGDLGDGFGLLDGLDFIVDFFGDVAE